MGHPNLNMIGVYQMFLSIHLITPEFGLNFLVSIHLFQIFYGDKGICSAIKLLVTDVQEAQHKVAVVLKKGKFKGKEIWMPLNRGKSED